MLEICALIALVGLAISIGGRIGRGNPFVVFFGLWLAICIGLMMSAESFYPVSSYLVLLIGTLLVTYLAVELVAVSHPLDARAPSSADLSYREPWLKGAQWASVAAVPLMYLQATSMAGGDVFSSAGYMALRQAMTEGNDGYGPLAYFVPLGFVVASIRLMQVKASKRELMNASVSVGAATAMAFLCTGRTFFLMLFCFMVFPLIVTGKVKLRGLVVAGVLLVVSFLMVAVMTRKGLSAEASIEDNLEGLAHMLRIYVLSPAMAMGVVADSHTEPLALGGYSLRFFQIIAGKLLGIGFEPVPLIREYVQVPDEINVFTVMDPYFRDFGYAGVMGFAICSALLHFTLYRRAQGIGGPWIFIYAATLFPLVMQFFQDMYATLLSTWVQVFFWYMVLVREQARPAIALNPQLSMQDA